MVKSVKWSGSWVALVTPFLDHEKIDFSGLATLIDFHLAHKTDGLVLLGTTGESSAISESEYKSLIAYVLKRINKKIPVMVGIGKNDTQSTLALAELVAQYDIDALLVVTPYYNRPSQEGLYRHYLLIAEKVSLPQVLYNVPHRTACDLLPATVKRLQEAAPEIFIGMKETVSAERVRELSENCKGMIIYSGDDSNNLAMLKAGAQGFISVTANLVPYLLHDLYEAFSQNRLDQAERIHHQLTALNRALFVEANPIPVKWALSKIGFIKNILRLPLTPLEEKYYKMVEMALKEIGITTDDN